ncbi:MAG: iron ABC transporter permease [Candidatus Thorarchaeota archaeon]|nr:iron ABC transporter permease [Candidatus Thorarchaeota archaeon]
MSGEDESTQPDTREEEPEFVPAAPVERLNYYVTGGDTGFTLGHLIVSWIKQLWLPLFLLIVMAVSSASVFVVFGINTFIQFLVVVVVLYVFRLQLIGFGKGLIGFFKNPGERTKGFGPMMRESVTKFRQEMDSLSWVQLLSVLIAFGVFLIAPLLSVIAFSFMDPVTGLPSLYHFTNLFSDSNFWPWQYNAITGEWISYANLQTIIPPSGGGDLLVIQGWDFGAVINSIYSAILVTIFSVLLGVFLAFIVARYDFPGKRVVRTVLIFPILATPFVGAIGIKTFMGRAGFFNNLFYTTLHIIPYRIEFQGLAAIIFVQSLSLFSLVYLNAYSSFMGIDPSLEEQAENLGATGFKLFRSVTLPLAMPGIQAGAILTFILSIEDLGTPIVFFNHPQARKTLAFQVYNSIATQSGSVDPTGPAIGIILLIFALVGFLTIRKYAALRSYESGTKGGQWNPRTRMLSSKSTALLYAILVPLLFVALIPQISVIILSLSGGWSTNAILPDVWTLSNYDVLWAYPDVTRSIQFTLIYGLIATVFIVLLGTSAAYIIARRDIPGKNVFDLLVTSPIALPGIVIATGYFTLFYNTPIFPPEGPWLLITISYMIRKFPFTVRAAYAGLQSTPVVLEEASMNMGASRNKTFTSITMPLIGVSVLAGSLLSFVYSVSEVSTSLILGSVGRQQAPMTFWTKEVLEGTGVYGGPESAATLGVLMMALQMAVITVTNKILGTRSSAMTGI